MKGFSSEPSALPPFPCVPSHNKSISPLHPNSTAATSDVENYCLTSWLGSMSGLPHSAASSRTTDAAAGGGVNPAKTTSERTSVKPEGHRVRKRTLDDAGVAASPDSEEDGVGASDERKRQPGVKRACNECRQQKVRKQSISAPAVS